MLAALLCNLGNRAPAIRGGDYASDYRRRKRIKLKAQQAEQQRRREERETLAAEVQAILPKVAEVPAFKPLLLKQPTLAWLLQDVLIMREIVLLYRYIDDEEWLEIHTASNYP